MAWRYGRWVVEHPLPLGASSRPAVGATVRAGNALATGSLLGSPVRVDGARKLGVEPMDVDRISRVRVGSDVTRGTVLARTGRRFVRAVSGTAKRRISHVTQERQR